ncbi:PstS family phosphate ABC transporter substrate-binding protein [Sphingobacterium yanglingense]|uniref:Phosphate transport system substrate-binding protein n=1 Tax=Sphingobacterium yanglingense TaxID=1437280 RepID=A0A4R6WGW7_9SPHI|nr:PstS family phosphate ABC transporter substrate-binding protein [Sphingobacterium yanglingense]TDQ77447.1 phosphate transport system substrate-binding protein [Sphingobacterium yanglingense]
MNRLTISILTTIFSLSCAPKKTNSYDSETGYSGNISISGAFALYPIVVLWSEDFKKIHPNVRFNISAGGAGKGITDVLTDMMDIGLVSRDLHQQELTKGALPIFVAKDAVLGTYNAKHPNAGLIKERGLTQRELEGIFVTHSYKKWNDIDPRFVDLPIRAYVRSDAAGAAETWAKFFGQNQEDLKGIGIFGDPGLAQAVKDEPMAIGFNNINYVYDLTSKRTAADIDVIPLDKNGNGKIDEEENFYNTIDELTTAVAAGKYPSPPSRPLAFVVKKDNINPLVQAFIRFVLDKKQQGHLLANGYVPMTEAQLAIELEKIKSETPSNKSK